MPTPEANQVTIREPDDWHLHLRDDDMMALIANYSARQFARAIIMPNLVPPVTTVAAAEAYRDRILDVLPTGHRFTPLMTAYLTDEIDPDEVETGHTRGVFTACKLYPAGATTNSAFGVTDVRNIYPVLERMQKTSMPLLIHGEVASSDIDIFDREAVFLETVLGPLLGDFLELKVVLEHITTADSVEFIQAAGPSVAATITPHHLRIDRNALFEGGLRPHAYCLLWPSARIIAPHCAKRRHPAIQNSFSELTSAPLIRGMTRKAPAVAPAFFARPRLWKATRSPSMKRMHSTAWKDLRRNSDRVFTDCR